MSILNIKDANGNFIPVKALNGKTPVKGIDYFTESDIQDIIDRVGGETSGSISFPISVFNGGTGATDAAGARSNLDITPANIGAAPATHNQSASTITSGTLSTDRLPTIPVTKGGTGATDALTAITNLKGVPILDAQGSSYDMNTIFDTGAYGWYKFNANTLNTAYKAGLTSATAGYILNIPTGATSGTRYGTQFAIHMADPSFYVRTIAGTTHGNWIKMQSGTIPVSGGGTGATDAATARSNLGITPDNIGAAPASHNQSASTITSGTLSANRLPTISVAKGGTGATDAATARANLEITPANIEAANAKAIAYTAIDNITVPGLYRTTGTPGLLIHLQWDTNYAYQIRNLYSDANAITTCRRKHNGTWQAWETIGTTDTLVNRSENASLSVSTDQNITPTISGKMNGVTQWTIGGYTADLNHLVIHYYNNGAWAGNNVILDAGNYKNYATPDNIGAVKKAGDTMTGSLTVPKLYLKNTGWQNISYKVGDRTKTELITYANNADAYGGLIIRGYNTDATAYKDLILSYDGGMAVSVGNGGTGATNAATARTNLGAAGITLVKSGNTSVAVNGTLNIGSLTNVKQLITNINGATATISLYGGNEGSINATYYSKTDNKFLTYGVGFTYTSAGTLTITNIVRYQVDSNGLKSTNPTSVTIGNIYAIS